MKKKSTRKLKPKVAKARTSPEFKKMLGIINEGLEKEKAGWRMVVTGKGLRKILVDESGFEGKSDFNKLSNLLKQKIPSA